MYSKRDVLKLWMFYLATSAVTSHTLNSPVSEAEISGQRNKRAVNTTIYWYFGGDDRALQNVTKVVRNIENIVQTNTNEVLKTMQNNVESTSSIREELNAMKQFLQTISLRLNTVFPLRPKKLQRNFDNDPKSCADILPNESGLYTLHTGSEIGLSVYCELDPNGGPAWTIIQRITNQHVFKNRDWADYENGFGDVEQDHWLGLKNIYKLQSMLNGSLELWIYKILKNGRIRYSKYRNFSIASSSSAYALKSIQRLQGNGFDNFKHSFGRNFTMEFNWTDGSTMTNVGWWCDKDGEVCESINYEFYDMNYIHMAIRKN